MYFAQILVSKNLLNVCTLLKKLIYIGMCKARSISTYIHLLTFNTIHTCLKSRNIFYAIILIKLKMKMLRHENNKSASSELMSTHLLKIVSARFQAL
jgi:hypothetical protein